MKYCTHCGGEMADEAVVCVNCGCAAPSKSAKLPVGEDTPSTGLNILAFLIPLVGLILYLMKHEQQPNQAKAIGKWAIIGFIVGIIFSIIYSAISAMALMSYM